MNVTLSSKGQVVVPKPVRDQLGLSAGDVLEVRVEEGSIVMSQVQPDEGPEDWRSWEGRFAGMPLIEDLLEEHRREVERDERLP